MNSERELPYFDKFGKQIDEFAVLKVFHFIGARKKKHYMYKWARLVEDKGKKYWYAQHLTDATAFFEKGSNKQWTGYSLGACRSDKNDPKWDRKLMDTEIVQCYNDSNKQWK